MRTLPRNRFFALLPVGAVGLFALGAGCAAPLEPTGEVGEHLTAEQCIYFDVNGKDTICHYTGSTSHPYTIVKTSDDGCIHGHTQHAHDYVAVGDPTCQGGGCLPQGAPCDATLPCCSGAACTNGTCVQTCTPTTCEANGQTCGTLADGCGDTLDCGSCDAGFACNAGQCEDIDDCAGNPCQNGGTCTDGVNAYTCTCTGGWTGTNCDQPPATCPCSGNPVWESVLTMLPTQMYLDDETGVQWSANFLSALAASNSANAGFASMCAAGDFANYNEVVMTNLTDAEAAACMGIIRAWVSDPPSCLAPQPVFFGAGDPCYNDPCGDGICMPDNGYYQCACPGGWGGNNCNIPCGGPV